MTSDDRAGAGRRRSRRTLLRAGLAVLAGLVLAVVGVGIFGYANIDVVRNITAQRLSTLTGRDVQIAGEFDLAPSLTPTVTASGLTIANAPWGTQPHMLTAKRVEVEIEILPLLLRGDVRIGRLVLSGAEVFIERGPGGDFNWRFTPRAAARQNDRERPPVVAISEVAVHDSTISWQAESGRMEAASVERLAWQADTLDSALALQADGTLEGDPFSIDGRLGAIETLLADDEPYPVRLDVQYGTARLQLEGVVGPRLAQEDTELAIRVMGQGNAIPRKFLNRELPDMGGWGLEARLSGTSERLQVSNLNAQLGEGTGLLVEIRSGSIEDVARGESVVLPVMVDGKSIAAAGRLLNADLPAAGAFQAEGTLSGSFARLALADFRGSIRANSELLLQVTEGRVEDVTAGRGIDLPLRAEGSSIAKLGRLFGIELPAVGAYEASGRIAGQAASPTLRNLNATIGRTDTVRLQVTNASVDNLLTADGLHIPFEIEGTNITLASHFGWNARLDSFAARGNVTGRMEALAVQDLEARAKHNGAVIRVSGGIGNVAELNGLDLSVSAEGASMASLAPLLPTNLPESPPFALSAEISGGANSLTLSNVSARVEDTRLQGQLEVGRTDSDVPQVTGSLSADTLDVDRLPELVQDATSAQAADRQGDRTPLDLPVLDALEAELALRAEEVVAEGRRFTDASTTIRLREGQLSVEDLTARIAGGAVAADAEVDAAAEAMAEVGLRLRVEGVELSQLVSAGVPGRVKGVLDVDVNVDATGRTLDELASNLEGQASAFGEAGQLENVPLNRLVPDLDIIRILPFFRREGTVRVNCLIGEVDIDSGVVQADSMLDTQRMTLLGRGAVDLEENTLDFSLRPVPKSRKLSATSVPLDIEGTLSDPQVTPRAGETIGGAVRGILGGLLVPLNQITALFGDDAKDACGEALKQARKRVRRRRNPR